MALDEWTITDADDVWDFRVTVMRDDGGKRPEEHADVYSPKALRAASKADRSITAADLEASVEWARRAVAAWENEDWQFAYVFVTPVHKATGTVFTDQSEGLSGIDYGWLPGPTADDKGTWTDDRAYVRTAWVDDIIDRVRGAATEALLNFAN